MIPGNPLSSMQPPTMPVDGEDQSTALFHDNAQLWPLDHDPRPIDDPVSYDTDWNTPLPDLAFSSNLYDGPNDDSEPVSYTAEPQVSCMNCDTTFPSNNKLHTHL